MVIFQFANCKRQPKVQGPQGVILSQGFSWRYGKNPGKVGMCLKDKIIYNICNFRMIIYDHGYIYIYYYNIMMYIHILYIIYILYIYSILYNISQNAENS
jgi:hypothetical protein